MVCLKYEIGNVKNLKLEIFIFYDFQKWKHKIN